jgi:hypothetical protein
VTAIELGFEDAEEEGGPAMGSRRAKGTAAGSRGGQERRDT